MSGKISRVHAMEILDSRGNPTLRAFVELDNGIHASASVPSGASTGISEALELRDEDMARYEGKGVLNAVQNVNARIGPRLIGMNPIEQKKIDHLMIELDGTANKSKLGANAILGVSMAVARAAAMNVGQPLYRYLGAERSALLPIPMINIINGGKHADNNLDFQEFMVIPIGAKTFSEAIEFGVETFWALWRTLAKYGYSTDVGDEGGFAPDLKNNEHACQLLVEAISAAGFIPGNEVAIGLDPAATSFFDGECYNLKRSGQGRRTSEEMIALYSMWIDKYPIISIEDGFAENDWEGFAQCTASLGKATQIVGDDLYVTNTDFIRRGIELKATNAVLIKLNQIGTLTETIDAISLCQQTGWNYIISHRSGETEDTFIADFAVAMRSGQIKTGSVCRGERVSKYNRLLEIQAELGKQAVFPTQLSNR
ncbi:MAG TPA: phosphopyruvate hydratase [Phycisphaerae bacterium]|nr:phosphopyruvate hydratase [Phycisphaerae bacterium]